MSFEAFRWPFGVDGPVVVSWPPPHLDAAAEPTPVYDALVAERLNDCGLSMRACYDVLRRAEDASRTARKAPQSDERAEDAPPELQRRNSTAQEAL